LVSCCSASRGTELLVLVTLPAGLLVEDSGPMKGRLMAFRALRAHFHVLGVTEFDVVQCSYADLVFRLIRGVAKHAQTICSREIVREIQLGDGAHLLVTVSDLRHQSLTDLEGIPHVVLSPSLFKEPEFLFHGAIIACSFRRAFPLRHGFAVLIDNLGQRTREERHILLPIFGYLIVSWFVAEHAGLLLGLPAPGKDIFSLEALLNRMAARAADP